MSVTVAHVVLLLAATNDPSSEVVARAAAQALAAPFSEPLRVVVRLVTEQPGHSKIAALILGAKADAVVVLTCARPGCARAVLRVAVGATPPTSRTIRFGPRDEPVERGRAIGLLASTILPDEWSRIGLAPAKAKATEAGTAAPAAAVAAGADTEEETIATAPAPRWAFETAVGLFGGVSNGVSEIGLTVAAQRMLVDRWAARLALKLELGETPGETGTTRGVGAALGVAWTSAGLARPGHFGVGARVDLVALERRVRLHMNAELVEGSSLSLGGDAAGLVGFALSPGAALVAGVGAEILSNGATGGDDQDDDLVLRRAAPSQFRIVAEFGVLARF